MDIINFCLPNNPETQMLKYTNVISTLRMQTISG
jgi:hypothetical protein